MKRQIIIGDVHGCYEELMELVDKVNFNAQTDELIFLGDLINKGPSSVKVLEFVKNGGHKSILGNHELGFLKALDYAQYMTGGFLKLAEELKGELSEYQKWLAQLPLYIEDDLFIAIHGGLEPGVPLNMQRAQVATRIRTWDGIGDDLNNPANPAWYELYKEDKLVVFGHWAAKGLIRRENAIGLDTGCVWGGELSCLILPEKKVQSIKAKRVYQIPAV